MIKSKTDGRDELMNLMKSEFGSVTISAGVSANASPGKKVWKGHNPKAKPIISYKPRSAGKNITIFRSLKKRRNVAFVTPAENARGSKIWEDAVDATLRGDVSALKKAADKLAKIMVENIRQHIKDGVVEAKSGKIKPLNPEYKKYKDRHYGEDLPVLKRTGELMKSLYPVVK